MSQKAQEHPCPHPERVITVVWVPFAWVMTVRLMAPSVA